MFQQTPIPRHVVIHEVGHMVVGLHLGVDEQGIEFRESGGDLAKAWYRCAGPEQLMMRSLAGISAHVLMVPSSLEPRIRAAYLHSVLFTPDHPHYSSLSAGELASLSGASVDLKLAHEAASKLYPHDPEKAREALRNGEDQVRIIIRKRLSDIERIANDVAIWAQEDDREYDGMFYHVGRARALIC